MSKIVSWYQDRHVVLTGCASGIGAALASLLINAGARITALDYRAPEMAGMDYRPLDLRNADAIEEVAKSIDGPIDALFNCAGVAPEMGFEPLDVLRVNFIGLRSLTEALLPNISEGGSITSIGSFAGRNWRGTISHVNELLATKSFTEAQAWAEQNPDLVAQCYSLSKEAVIVWTMRSAAETIRRGVRMNAASPGPVRTALMDAIDPLLPPGMMEKVAGPLGRYTVPDEQAEALLFLGSGGAFAVNGVVLPVDGGQDGLLLSMLK